MEWNDTALILHMGRFRENDLWVRLLSRQRGIFNVFAFGGSRSKKRFCGCLDVLNVVKCRIKSTGRGAYLCMQEGVLLRGPRLLRGDYSRYGMIMNCVRFMEAMGVPEEGAGEAFNLIDGALGLFEDSATLPHSFFPLFFRLALASRQGLAPALDLCAACGREHPEHGELRIADGQLFCPDCGDSGGIFLAAPALGLLRALRTEPPALWNTSSLSLVEQRAAARAIDGFVNYHLGIIWDDGRFKKM